MRGDVTLKKKKKKKCKQTLDTRNNRNRIFHITSPRQVVNLGWSKISPSSPVSKRLRRLREVKDARVIGYLEEVESNTQSLDSHPLSFASLLDNEKECQSSDYERSASTGLFNKPTQ